MTLLETIKEFWYLAVAMVTGIGGLLTWLKSRKKKEADSTQLLYEQLEDMKKTLIARVQQDMERATSVAEKQHIIDNFKIHCPDCYATIMQKIYPNVSEENI